MSTPVIQLIAERQVGKTRRVWGWLVCGDRAVTFWRTKQRGKFTFKKSETYAGNRTVADKEDEKLEEHGYKEVPNGSARHNQLHGRILREFQTENPQFHGD